MTDSDAVTTKQKESIATAEALAAARESRNLSQVDISQRIKLQVRQVAALEEGRWEALPGKSFVRGALRSYGKLLDVDVAPLLESIGGFAEPAAMHGGARREDAALSRSSGLGFDGGGRGSPILWVIAGLIGVVALVLYFGSDGDLSRLRSWLPSSGSAPAGTAGTAGTGTTAQSGAGAASGQVSMGPANWGSVAGTAPAGAGSPMASASPTPPERAAPSGAAGAAATGGAGSGSASSGGASAGSTAFGTLAPSAFPAAAAGAAASASSTSGPASVAGGAAGAAGGSPASVSTPAPADTGSAERTAVSAAAGAGAGAAAGAGTTAGASGTPAAVTAGFAAGVARASADATAPAAAAEAPRGVLRFKANEDSWVEVRDASGALLHHAVLKAGGSLELKGSPPYRVVLGNPGRLEFVYEGNPIDLAPHTSRSNIARMQLK